MNENSGETPNPLNTNPEVTPVDEFLDANPAELAEEEQEDISTREDHGDIPMGITQDDESTPEEHEEAPTEDDVKLTPEEHRDVPVEDDEEPTSEEHEEAPTEDDDEKPLVEEHEDVPAEDNDKIVNDNHEEPKPIITNAGAPEAKATATAAPVSAVAVGSLDPTGRAMEQKIDPDEGQVHRRSKKGLIFALFGCFFLLASIVAVVAAVMLTKPKLNPVDAAMQKIMSGETPKNVAIDGDIDIFINDDISPIKRINVDLDSDTVVGSMINTSSAVLNLTDRYDNDYSMEFSEVYAAQGDLFFKVNGLADLMQNENFLYLMTRPTYTVESTSNCVTDENGLTTCGDLATNCVNANESNCVTTIEESPEARIKTSITESLDEKTIQAIEAVDGVWIKISLDELSSAENAYFGDTSNISCITNLVSGINKNSNSALGVYEKNPFIVSSDKNVVLSSKNYPVYQIGIDSEQFVNYLNAIQNTDLAQSVNNCLGWQNNVAVTKSDADRIIATMPTMYAEIDNENNFSRLYLESSIEEEVDCDCADDEVCDSDCVSSQAAPVTTIIDLNFNYPKNVNVSEPIDYTDYKDVIQNIMMSMFNLQGGGAAESGATN